MHKYIYLILGYLLLSISTQAQVTTSKKDGNWTVLLGSSPFEIKGVTFGYEEDNENYGRHFNELRKLGVNTIRTWGTGKNTAKLLDSANAYDIKVMLGIWMRHGRPGMEADDSFNYLTNTAGIRTMYESALKTVRQYKTHPALLAWGVGNEVYLNTATDEEKKAYSLTLEKVCSGIKQLDTQHPIVSVEAWTFGLDWWETYVPSLDIYGINCYGAGASLIQGEMEKRNISKPYVITEFGVTGEWDSPEDEQGVAIEPSDREKYEAISKGYPDWIKSKPSCLGVYVFHYSDGDQFMAPWLFTHYKGMYRPQYWAIREAFTGAPPTNNVPLIDRFELPEGTFESDSWVPVILQASDEEGENLSFSFHYNQRTGSRKRRDQINQLFYRGNLKDGFEIQMPKENGAVKIYVNVSDAYPNIGTASTSIIVNDEIAKNRKYLVPKAALPFYVYKDLNHSPYIPSALMGNYEDIVVDLESKEQVYAGESAIAISYNSSRGWYGVAFVDPPNDWGDMLGGFDLSGAEEFSFWAKSNDEKIKATIGFGLIESDKPYPDTAKEHVEIELTTKWKYYKIKTKKLDMSCIRSGLVIFSSATIFPHKIFIDEVMFQ